MYSCETVVYLNYSKTSKAAAHSPTLPTLQFKKFKRILAFQQFSFVISLNFDKSVFFSYA